jgi:hypothetical protein
MNREQSDPEVRKRAIFEGMSKRGQERILRIGYENWDPFQEPKDPRERIFSSSSLKAGALVKEFLHIHQAHQESSVLIKDLFELCKGLIDGEARARVILEFCHWYESKVGNNL